MRSISSAWCVLSLAAVSAASGGVIVSTFDPGNQYQTGSGYAIGDPQQESAAGFALSASYNVTQIDLPLWFVNGVVSSINAFSVQIATDDGGLPGTVLGSWALDNISTNAYSDYNTITFSPLLLNAGSYFLMVSAPNTLTWGAWNRQNTPINGLYDYSEDDGASWLTLASAQPPAFDLVGTTAVMLPPTNNSITPEPLSFLMTGLGLGLLGLRRRR